MLKTKEERKAFQFYFVDTGFCVVIKKSEMQHRILKYVLKGVTAVLKYVLKGVTAVLKFALETKKAKKENENVN